MFGLADRGNKNKGNSVRVMFCYYWNYMVAIGKKLHWTLKWNTKTLVNKPKRKLQPGLMNHEVSSNITDTTTYEKLNLTTGSEEYY